MTVSLMSLTRDMKQSAYFSLLSVPINLFLFIKPFDKFTLSLVFESAWTMVSNFF